MAYFEWAEDMAIDGGEIDADHRLLVDQVNELHTATSEGLGREVVESLLHRLIETTQEHLHKEERLMAQRGFPNLEKHKIGHHHFMNKLRELEQKQKAGSITVAAQLSSVMRDWLSLHIRRNDKELLRFERDKARQAQRAQGAPLQGHAALAKPGRAAVGAPKAALALGRSAATARGGSGSAGR